MLSVVLAFLSTSLGRKVLLGLGVFVAIGGAYWNGHHAGAAVVQAKWDAAVTAEQGRQKTIIADMKDEDASATAASDADAAAAIKLRAAYEAEFGKDAGACLDGDADVERLRHLLGQ